MQKHLAIDSLRFISINGLYRAVTEGQPRNTEQPQYCDACFSENYPVPPTDSIAAKEIELKPGKQALLPL